MWRPCSPPPHLRPKNKKKPMFVIRDVRLFSQYCHQRSPMMKTAGVDANCERQETDDSILLTIRIPKQTAQAFEAARCFT